MDTWNERLAKALRDSGKTWRELADACGVEPGSVSDWKSGKTKNLKAENADKAAAFVGLSVSQLLYGRERKAMHIAERTGDYAKGPRITQYSAAPVVGTAQLGPDGFWAETDHPTGHGDGYVDVPTRDPNAYALRVRGDSMAPAIRNGWLVVVEPNHQAVTGELVLVCTNDGRCMIKELLADRTDDVYLGSVNQDHKPITLQRSEITKLHYVGFIAPPSKMRL
jgi:phage repressor protein C with HTH and peptisase S24 domain